MVEVGGYKASKSHHAFSWSYEMEKKRYMFFLFLFIFFFVNKNVKIVAGICNPSPEGFPPRIEIYLVVSMFLFLLFSRYEFWRQIVTQNCIYDYQSNGGSTPKPHYSDFDLIPIKSNPNLKCHVFISFKQIIIIKKKKKAFVIIHSKCFSSWIVLLPQINNLNSCKHIWFLLSTLSVAKTEKMQSGKALRYILKITV